jgi:hypothetical protein
MKRDCHYKVGAKSIIFEDPLRLLKGSPGEGQIKGWGRKGRGARKDIIYNIRYTDIRYVIYNRPQGWGTPYTGVIGRNFENDP